MHWQFVGTNLTSSPCLEQNLFLWPAYSWPCWEQVIFWGFAVLQQMHCQVSTYVQSYALQDDSLYLVTSSTRQCVPSQHAASCDLLWQSQTVHWVPALGLASPLIDHPSTFPLPLIILNLCRIQRLGFRVQRGSKMASKTLVRIIDFASWNMPAASSLSFIPVDSLSRWNLPLRLNQKIMSEV